MCAETTDHSCTPTPRRTTQSHPVPGVLNVPKEWHFDTGAAKSHAVSPQSPGIKFDVSQAWYRSEIDASTKQHPLNKRGRSLSSPSRLRKPLAPPDPLPRCRLHLEQVNEEWARACAKNTQFSLVVLHIVALQVGQCPQLVELFPFSCVEVVLVDAHLAKSSLYSERRFSELLLSESMESAHSTKKPILSSMSLTCHRPRASCSSPASGKSLRRSIIIGPATGKNGKQPVV